MLFFNIAKINNFKIEGGNLKKYYKKSILALLVSVLTINSLATPINALDKNPKEDEVEEFIEFEENKVKDIFSLFSDQGELNWYYVGKGKDNVAEGPKESVDFLKENDACYLGDTSKKVIYLTFDEGYENGNTGKILDTLKKLNVPAAFFVVRPYIDTEPDLIKRMVDEGHLVCNHSSHHPSMASIHDKAKFEAEFTDVEEAYKKVVGKDMPKYFRPPMGKYSKESLKMTKDLGYKSVFWSFAYKDWLVKNQPAESFAIDKITKGAHPGCIMLLHAVSDTNAKILDTVIKKLQDDGYEFKSLNELPTE
ncbi:delta-lactam-biosynthetic de-N-acetylase [Clostridium botulinum]|uniref:delta-lactam-biosynthetic de-N-acetylase n=1 Tax=Clostridium TaxID=1485 RepID=UPI0009AFDCD2|nr:MULTISPECIES: delta-lactam-biosynthetic de-N-acetylase [unclassified Clostridium]KAI3347096.1 delta-lactam-biosynthetic de-N-acetylase [Clostridium botulinum]MBY6777562.1 delta-lactam-biosynthetic de-N-acetylase [Clostridium botulinum]MBY6802724.1 delta-lactam-biosynthetic de-N-acetylase [Clostridium botulinum]MBY6812843.1 delta-lactam-biosynthetic de-N-acetylase [Clostridium botulinum]MBY6819031.1 delta-lactam-biosynthetic de-N-acetylase [Clostridium botulinum]